MKKEEFKKGLEDYYFEKFKDSSGLTRKKLEQQVIINCRNLYVRIQNYQLEKYGYTKSFLKVNTYKKRMKKLNINI